jgi:hypothetical protein
MKKIITSAFALAAFAVLLGALLQPQTAISNAGGAPGSGSCTSCHGGTAQTSSDLIMEVLDMTSGPVTEYVPGTEYMVYIEMTKASTQKYGFALSANAGTFSKLLPTDNDIQINTGYVTHTSSGNTFSDDTAVWALKWTAPATGTGNIPFQLYVNATNGDNTSNGDAIYTKQLVLNQGATGLAKINALNHVHVFPQPAADVLNIAYELKQGNTVTLEITDINGRVVYNNACGYQMAGEHTQKINTNELGKGVYFLRMTVGGESMARKVLVQ